MNLSFSFSNMPISFLLQSLKNPPYYRLPNTPNFEIFEILDKNQDVGEKSLYMLYLELFSELEKFEFF
jgi:hypothetical protein